MLQTKFQTSEASGSEEGDFWIFSIYFYNSNLGLSGGGGAILYPTIWIHLVEDH